MSTRPHSYARYRLDGCRCYVCGLARSEYDDRRNRLIAYGRWEPFTAVEETRHRIGDLKSLGFGDRAIAALAGVERKSVRDVLSGHRHDPGRGNPSLTKIRKETAAAIAAIPFDQLAAADGAYISAHMTWQRIHALIRAGYPRTWIARELGSTSSTPSLQIGADRVTAANARAVRDLVLNVGLAPGPSSRARREGEREGWPLIADLLDSMQDSGHGFLREGSHRSSLVVSARDILTGVAASGTEDTGFLAEEDQNGGLAA